MQIYSESGLAGSMKVVDGDIYKDGAIVSTFKADAGTADKQKQVLILTGNVTISSKKPTLTLTCNRLVYNADTGIVRASGSIRVNGQMGTIIGLEELMTTAELDQLATPDMFKK